MNEPWRIAVAVLFLVVLAGALVWAVLDGVSDDPGPDASTAPQGVSSPTSSPDAGDAPGTTLPSVPPTTVPTTTGAFTTLAPVVVTVPPPPAEVTLADVLPAVENALAAWGEFAVTGDLELIETTFDLAGPQYAQLREEAAALAAEPLGPPPYVFTVTEPSLRRPDPDRAVVVGDVALDRPGEPTQTFRWRIVMRWVGGDWVLWTVRDEGE